jgi:hypothetical protein
VKAHFVCSESHFIDHLAPVWRGLPEGLRGAFWATPDLVPYALTLVPEASEMPRWIKVGKGDYAVIAAEQDRKRVVGVPTVRFEHGCGLSYGGNISIPLGAPTLALQAAGFHPAYPGGRSHQGVRAFLNPNRYSADRWRESYPGAVVEIVGTPKLDEVHNALPKTIGDPPVVCISFHADILVAPETMSAFPFYRDVVVDLAKRTDIQVIGHSHPKARAERQEFFEANGIEFVPSFAEVMRRADVYAVDNSSTLFEFASLDRPVVVINGPMYRRDVHHGLRFWEHSDVGVNCDVPMDLSDAIDRALEDPFDVWSARQEATADLYPYRGHAAERAAEVIGSLEMVPV